MLRISNSCVSTNTEIHYYITQGIGGLDTDLVTVCCSRPEVFWFAAGEALYLLGISFYFIKDFIDAFGSCYPIGRAAIRRARLMV